MANKFDLFLKRYYLILLSNYYINIPIKRIYSGIKSTYSIYKKKDRIRKIFKN